MTAKELIHDEHEWSLMFVMFVLCLMEQQIQLG